ncbi:uncharacterized protein MELLADRAFT_105498 [Melampsora larici-populina 98AG31]|uniref:Uncharacterized protein n=1 Tax=Melampsora larici-populina (strain 98AG31 / pathotype 3-4-7) TaxID=747676 RepID=F4RIC8_MELLP|nr:uncharacterized protein MELLADRAFT_105498 [Melampsora larici-populina 98AG31]EGG07990.1 hypothetical protein MELLADRAFT_105498 [Melampsora larici-populina 98AG31]
MLQPTRTLQKGIRQYEHMPLRCSGIFKLEKERRPRVANIEILQARGGNCDGQLHSATTNVPDAGHSETLSHRVAPSTYGDANYHVACVRHQQWDMTLIRPRRLVEVVRSATEISCHLRSHDFPIYLEKRKVSEIGNRQRKTSSIKSSEHLRPIYKLKKRCQSIQRIAMEMPQETNSAMVDMTCRTSTMKRGL